MSFFRLKPATANILYAVGWVYVYPPQLSRVHLKIANPVDIWLVNQHHAPAVVQFFTFYHWGTHVKNTVDTTKKN